MSLTELKPSDHPDCHVMQWTDMEIRFINDRVSAATAPLQEQIKELQLDVIHKDAFAEQLGRELAKATSKIADLERQLELVRNAVLEEAAVKCAEIAEDRWAAYKNRPPYEGNETTRYSLHTEGESDGADSCAAAIRAMKHEPNTTMTAAPRAVD